MRSETMKSCRIQLISLILAGLNSMPTHAEAIPGRWEKVADLDLGTPIIVELKNGDQVEGDFEGLSESEMDIETHFARAVIPKGDIQTITARKRSSMDEGAKKGALVGVGVGLAVSYFTLTSSGAGDLTKTGAAMLASAFTGLSTLFGAGIGAGIGAAADTATKSKGIVLYEAPGTPQRSMPGDSE